MHRVAWLPCSWSLVTMFMEAKVGLEKLRYLVLSGNKVRMVTKLGVAWLTCLCLHGLSYLGSMISVSTFLCREGSRIPYKTVNSSSMQVIVWCQLLVPSLHPVSDIKR